ncbi:MAG: hypothetical protein V3U65_13880 [Granulosicoccaceae bacterium]
MLLPAAQPMMQTAVASFLSGHRLAGIMTPCVQIASWAGGPFSRVSSNVSLMSQNGRPSPLRQLISTVIGRNDFQIALRVSFGRPNAKTVALAISKTGEALCYVKLGSEAMTSDLVAHEGAILKQFNHAEMPVILPKRLYSGTWANGQSVLITAPLQLAPLKRDARIAHAAAEALVSQNGVTSSALIDSAYWHRIVEFVGEHDDSEVLQTAVSEIERSWGACEFDFGISHGDWTRANLGMVKGQVAALDWERCTKFAPSGIDIAHFAICEKTTHPFTKAISIDRVAEKVRQYLKSAGLLPNNAEVLILFALLEMVIRFKSAKSAGLRSTDLKFGPALQGGVRKWAL